jgi:hypothetical protein
MPGNTDKADDDVSNFWCLQIDRSEHRLNKSGVSRQQSRGAKCQMRLVPVSRTGSITADSAYRDGRYTTSARLRDAHRNANGCAGLAVVYATSCSVCQLGAQGNAS